jgi:hypothetical protein
VLVRAAGFVLTLLVALAIAARADERYSVEGRDTVQVRGGGVGSEVTYTGSGRLTIERTSNGTRFTTVVDYARLADGTTTRSRATFQTTITPAGVPHDGIDGDPDDLTILNQPFAIQLDAPTLRDLRTLGGMMPFDFPSPLTGGTLHGALRRLPDGPLQGVRVLGIAFSASGPLRGNLPDRPGLAMTGTITMNGRAYYAYATALLVALEATLQIDGVLGDGADRRPVTIVYRRTIRPLASAGAALH